MTPTDIQNLINLLLTGGQNTVLQFRNLLTAMLQYIESVDQTTVNTVTGDLVDNTDINNPVIITPTFQQVSDSGGLNNNTNIIEGPLGGIALVCTIDLILEWYQGALYSLDSNTLINKVQFKTIAPTVNDDDTKLFKVDSYWEMNDGTRYKCTDSSTGAAVWVVDNFISLQDSYNGGNIVNSSRVFIDANNFAIGNDAGFNNTGNNTTFIGNSAGLDQTGNEVVAMGVQAANENEGDNVIALGTTAGRFNRLNNSFIIGPNELPKFTNLAAAQAAITVANGASTNNNYLFLDASDNTVKVIIPS